MSLFQIDEGGWPYADGETSAEEELVASPEGNIFRAVLTADDPFDDDAVALHAFEPHLLDDLDELEREVICGRFGVNGCEVQSMKDLHHRLGVPREDLRAALASGLTKIRSHLLTD